MDPVSMLGVVGAAFSVASRAWTVGHELYQFFKDTKIVDDTATCFANEVLALGSACGAVGKRLEEMSRSEGHRESGKVTHGSNETWKCLRSQLMACEITVDGLGGVVSSITATAAAQRSTNFMTSALRQIRINMKAADIAEARNRIQSHTASLQIVLQAFTIDIIYLTPQRVDQHLQAQLADLATKRQGLEGLIADRGADAPEDPDVRHEKDILLTAEKVLSSGETLYSASVAGLSVVGDAPPGKSAYVQDWIQQTNELEDITSDSSVNDPFGTSSDANPRTGLASQTEDTASTTNVRRLVEDDELDLLRDSRDAGSQDLDPEDEFRIEAATAAIAEGRSLFDAENYHAADSTLQEALVMIRELPIKHQAVGDPCNLRYMLGVCAFHLRDPPTAEAALLSVVEATPKAKVQNNTRRLQVLDAGHLLAITYLRLGKPDQARIYCESTFQGRRKLLGKDDPSTYPSLALMARILELQGNQSRSNIYSKMLPEERRTSLTQLFSVLSLPDSESHYRDLPKTVTSSSAKMSTSNSVQTPSSAGTETELIRSMSMATTVAASVVETPLSVEDIPTVCPKHYQPPPVANSTERERRWNFLASEGVFPLKPPTSLRALVEGRTQESYAFASKDSKSLKWLMSGSKTSQQLQNLALAALFGDQNVVTQLIVAHKTDVQQQLSEPPSPRPLHFAALGGYPGIVEAMIHAGSKVSSTSHFGTPLGIAITLERLDIVDILLRQEASVNATSQPLGSPLNVACATLNMSLFEALCRHPHSDVNKFSFMRLDRWLRMRGLFYGEADEAVRRALAFCRSIIPRSRLPKPPYTLMVEPIIIESGLVGIAAAFGNAAAIRILRNRNANVNDMATVTVRDGHAHFVKRVYSPLTLASMTGSAAAIETLFACGADVPDVKDNATGVRDSYRYNDPLMHSIRNGHADCAVKLLEHSCPIDPRDLTWAGRQKLDAVVSKAKEMRSISNWMILHVRFVADQSTITIFVRPNETIHGVKLQLQECARLPNISKLRLLYFGRDLENDDRTLDSYDITEGSMIYVPA